MRGLCFEEFEVGAHYKHALTRTITEMDNVLFTSLTMNVQPLHLDEEFAKSTIHGQRVLNSLFTVALIGAFHVPELTMGTTLGNLGYDSIKFPHPVFHGDTLRGETTILEKRESKSRDRLRHRLVRAPRAEPARRGRLRHDPRRPDGQEPRTRREQSRDRGRPSPPPRFRSSPHDQHRHRPAHLGPTTRDMLIDGRMVRGAARSSRRSTRPPSRSPRP